MAYFARVLDGVVQEPAVNLPDGKDPSAFYPADLPGAWQAAPDGTPQSGWTYAGGAYSAPVAAPPTLAQQAAATLAGGLTIESTAHPEVNGTYPASASAQMQIMAEMISLLDGIFTNGAATMNWPDTAGALHTFDGPTFQAFARAHALFVTGCIGCENGHATALPAASVTIA